MNVWEWVNLASIAVCGGFVVWSNDRATRAMFLGPLLMAIAFLMGNR